MANLTLYVPDDLKKRMDSVVDVSWSGAVRSFIERKLDDLEEANRLARSSKLTPEDVRRLAVSVNRKLGVHARKLLDETRN
jgi:hypothetical protein